MAKSIFIQGQPQDISEVLVNKDDRVALQNALMKEFPTAKVLAVKLNIPGPIKNNLDLDRLFNIGFDKFLSFLTTHKVPKPLKLVTWEKTTGDEAFLIVDKDAILLKRLAVTFESEFSLGRLFDIDVLTKNSQQPLSRSDLSLPARTCLICGRPAKDCARSRRHSVVELQDKISALYWQYFEKIEVSS